MLLNWFPPHLENDHRSRLASLQLFTRLVRMTLRGLWLRPWLASVKGPLLIGQAVRMANPQYLTTTGRVIIEDLAEIQAISSRGITFGSQVSIGRSTMIRPSGNYSREVGEGMSVGNRSSIGPHCFIGCSGFISIGDNVMLGPGVRLFAENHVYADNDVLLKDQGVQRDAITIEDDCWIASGVTVTAGVTIGHGSVVGAGSVVTKDIPPFSIAAGVPAKILSSRSEV